MSVSWSNDVIVGRAISSAAKGSSLEMVAGKKRSPMTPCATAGAETTPAAKIIAVVDNKNWGVVARS